MKKKSVEYKQKVVDSHDVIVAIAEQAIDGWEPVCVYPHAVMGESTMNLLVRRVKIIFRRKA